uniref:Follicular dendritic cell secreted peptide n=1 Tax=Bursaphelenchus xylophilus TaxID=6326 RepID=A0A1I7SLQ4_BURXY
MRAFLSILWVLAVSMSFVLSQSDTEFLMDDLVLQGRTYPDLHFTPPPGVVWRPGYPPPRPIYEFPEHVPTRRPRPFNPLPPIPEEGPVQFV